MFKQMQGNTTDLPLQMNWLRMIKNHLINAYHIDKEDFGYTPNDALGGIGKMNQLFGADY
ncbi:MAG: type I restriction-modification enzyme R subunit C-terminal domain-containing protein [Lentimicrobiaceae bacterium]|nr:type I restriction-modification enzyme R subunit C-terminal domain-containing protein [Lentimicrobiaceae bacterium]